MTKIVCDFDTVYANCNKLENYVVQMKQDIIDNQKNAESNLVWQGNAKNEFIKSLTNHSNVINRDIASLESKIKFIRKSAQEIEKLENELSKY